MKFDYAPRGVCSYRIHLDLNETANTINSVRFEGGCSGNTQGVPTLFRHVLTKVAFKFKTVANPNPNVGGSEVVVKDVKIHDIYSKGSYTQIPQGTDAKVWAGQSEATSYVFNAAADTIVLKAGRDARGTKTVENRILLPQVLVASAEAGEGTPAVAGQKVEISYTIRTNYGTETEPKWTEENVTSTVDLLPPTEPGSTTTAIPEWEPNMSIVYTLTISPFSDVPILFDPAIADWSSVTGEITVTTADEPAPTGGETTGGETTNP